MSTPTTLIERFNEIAAIAACEQQLKQLRELVSEPSGKRYVRSQEQRAVIWRELASSADDRAATPAPRAVKRKATVATSAAAANAPTDVT